MAIKIPVDFTDVEQRASVRVAPGDYIGKVVKVEKKNSSEKGTPGLYVTFEGLSGEFKGKRLQDRHWLTKDSLWTLRNMLEAMGYKVKPSKMTITDAMILGKKVGLTLIDGEEYKGRVRSEVGDYIPVSAVGNKVSGDDVDEEDEEDEDDPLSEFEDEPEEDEEEGEDEEEEDDEDEDEEGDNEDEDEDEDEELSFTLEDISEAKAPELKAYLVEAMEAGWEFELGDKPKAAEVREVLKSLFEDEEDDEDMEGFELDDME